MKNAPCQQHDRYQSAGQSLYTSMVSMAKKKKASPGAAPSQTLTSLFALLRVQGASAVRWLDVVDIVVDERVRLKCQIPLCDSYRFNLMCPPHVPSVAEFRSALLRFSGAVLIQITEHLTKPTDNNPSADVFAPAKRLHQLIHLAEKQAFEGGARFATGLIGSCCRLCEECVAVRSGTSCRYPFRARPSMEAMGIDVMATAERAGLPLRFPVVHQVTWTGCVLI